VVLRFLLVLIATIVLSMAHGYEIVLLAVDHLQAAVAQDLSSRYCPHSGGVFLTRLFALFAPIVAAALALLFAANRRSKGGSVPTLRYIAACALLAFAIGSGALILYGLSGCSGPAAEGLIWDWP
jgi:hypothetical protein